VWNTASPEVQAAILALAEFYEERLAKLEARVIDLENRLKLNSTNSSKPPSSDPIGMKRKPPASPSGKKRGGQPGHRKAFRALVPPEKIRETTHCKPTACRRCGHELCGDDPAPLIHQVAELPKIEPIVDEYRLHRLTCPGCGETTCAALPPGVTTGCFGPYLQAVLAMLAGAYRLSKRQVQQLVSDLFTLSISTGMVSKLERQSAIALEAPYNELATSVHESEAVNIDETSWRENRRKAWLWATVTGLCTVFTIAKSRSGEIAAALLGSKDDQVVGSDRLARMSGSRHCGVKLAGRICAETSKRWSTEVVRAKERERGCFRCRTACSVTGTGCATGLCRGMRLKGECTACVGKSSKPFWKGRGASARKRRPHATSFSR
jgi:transposase